MAKEQSKRQEIINDIKTILGDGMVDVELDPKHYEQGIDLAVDKFSCLLYTSDAADE